MKYEYLTMTRFDSGVILPDKQLVKYFLIDGFSYHSYTKCYPLTMGNFFRLLLSNYLTICKWATVRLLYKLGFVRIKEGEAFTLSNLTWKFWQQEASK